MQIIETPAELRAAISAARTGGQRIGFVPTMGALHEGHLSLVTAARRECDFVVVSIFVNPTQFGPGEDFEKYPRPLKRDTELLKGDEVGIVFAPPAEVMYAPGKEVTWVEVAGDLTTQWEGAARPEHFRGVTTVVAKLFNLVLPDVAYFGQKDYQQSVVIRRMTGNLHFPIEIRVCPTVREPDGLAKSSRNQYLNERQRQQAISLSRGLFAARDLFDKGRREADALFAAVQAVLSKDPDVQVEYIAIADPETLAPLENIEDRAVVAVAARIGDTRLIDNLILEANGE